MTTSRDLLQAIAVFLRDDIGSQAQLDAAASPELAYKKRIAMNLLALVQRDIALGSLLADQDTRFFASVAGEIALTQQADACGYSADAQRRLACALRDGELGDNAAVREHLKLRALLALAIDNPRYSGYRQAREAWPALAQREAVLLDSKNAS